MTSPDQTLPPELEFPDFVQGAMGENGSGYRPPALAEREAGYRASGLEPVAAGGIGEIWVTREAAVFVEAHGFGCSHLNQYALHAYQLSRAQADPDHIRDRFITELVDELAYSATAAADRFERLRQAAIEACGEPARRARPRP